MTTPSASWLRAYVPPAGGLLFSSQPNEAFPLPSGASAFATATRMTVPPGVLLLRLTPKGTSAGLNALNPPPPAFANYISVVSFGPCWGAGVPLVYTEFGVSTLSLTGVTAVTVQPPPYLDVAFDFSKPEVVLGVIGTGLQGVTLFGTPFMAVSQVAGAVVGAALVSQSPSLGKVLGH